MKNVLLNLVAAGAIKSAKKAGGCASVFGLCQPKEPKKMTEKKRN